MEKRQLTASELYITSYISETKKSSSAGRRPVKKMKELIHSLWCGRWMYFGAATAFRIAEGSGKDRDSFGFDFLVVAAVIPPP